MSDDKWARSVELVQAFSWTCDECGTDHFERGVTISPEAIDPGDVPVGLELPDGVLLMAPDRVRCPDCGTSFRTEEPDHGR